MEVAMANLPNQKVTNPYEDVEPEKPEVPAEAAAPETAAPTSTPIATKKRPGRFKRFLRLALLILFSIAIIFGLGAGTAYALLYQPVSRQLADTQTQLASSQQALADAQSQITQLQGLKTRNTELSSKVDTLEAHIQLLQAYSKVVEAQVALANKDTGSVRTSLNRAEGYLKDLKNLLPGDQTTRVDEMTSRLNLTLTGLGSDNFATQSDLNVLAAGLIRMENDLFGG
jgi:uncharacterized protein HemX